MPSNITTTRSSTADALLKKMLSKISHRKTTMLESLFKKVTGLKLVTLLKKRLQQMFSCRTCDILKNNYFQEHLGTTDFELNALNKFWSM